MRKETEHRDDSSRKSSTNLCYISPYEFTKTGRTGKHRASMLQSDLPILSELGKPHRRGHKLPPPDFTYGIKITQRHGGVAEAMCYTPERERAANPDFILVRDYPALNKAAVEAGMLTARDQSRFRTKHDIKKKIFLCDVSRTKKTSTFPDDMVFGTSYKPSTPIAEVIQHRFADKWLENIQNKQANLKKKQSHTNTLKGRYHTKASLLRQTKIPVEPKPFRKTSEFINVEHQIDSFRSEAERRKALIANVYDSIPRQGTYHSGIYKVPRTTVKT